MKYGADYNRYKSQRSNEEHYEHRIYYDLHIRDIKQINEQEFIAWNPSFQIVNIKKNKTVAELKGEKYLIETDILILHQKVSPEHVQVEGDELHGDLVDIPVVFRMPKYKTVIRCKPNYFTGREEIRDGDLYREFTTGVLLEDGETCDTEWRLVIVDPDEDEPCIAGQPTGRKEQNGRCVRFEYFTGNLLADGETCEAEWGEWICNCTQGEPTGRTKRFDGWIWKEYFNSDCSTFWEKDIRIPEGIGCLSIVLVLLAILWAIFCIWLAAKYGSFLPILFGIGIPLLLAGVGSGINFLGRYSLGISRIFGWIMSLVAFIVMLSLLSGLFNFFSGTDWSLPKVDDSYDQQEVVEVDPNRQDESNAVPESSEGRKKQIRVHLRWKDFENRKYEGAFNLKVENIRNSRYNLNSLVDRNYNSYGPVYNSVYNTDKSYLNGLYHMLDSIRVDRKQNRFQFAHTIVTMVQSIDYVLILEQSCNDPMVLRNNQIREILRSGVPCEGFAPFGIKTPMEFLSTMKGDCDTRTLLLYTIFKHYGYDVAIINSEYYGHSMLGLSLPEASGAYKAITGEKYYFWETTAKGFRLGQLQRNMGMLNYWKIEIN